MPSAEITGLQSELLGVAREHYAELPRAALPNPAHACLQIRATADSGYVARVTDVQKHEHAAKMLGLFGDHAPEVAHRISGGLGVLGIAFRGEDVGIALDDAMSIGILFGLQINAMGGDEDNQRVVG